MVESKQDTYDNIVLRRRGALCMPGYLREEYRRIVFNTYCFIRQQWLRERALVLRLY
jgi:hypothetical protein